MACWEKVVLRVLNFRENSNQSQPLVTVKVSLYIVKKGWKHETSSLFPIDMCVGLFAGSYNLGLRLLTVASVDDGDDSLCQVEEGKACGGVAA